MDSVLHDLSAPALVTAIEANLFEFFAAFRRWPEAEVHDEPQMLWTLTSVPCRRTPSTFAGGSRSSPAVRRAKYGM